MVVHPKKSWLSLLLAYRGSVFPQIWRRLLFTTVVSVVVTEAYHQEWMVETITPLPFTLIGLALGIFLGFRNNTSYDRFWEGRKLWGRMVNASRSYCRQVLTLISPFEAVPHEDQRTLVYRQIAYVHAFRMHLRHESGWSTLAPWIPKTECEALAKASNPPISLLQETGKRLTRLWKAGRIDPLHLPVLEASLTEFTTIQGACERIRSTPIPFGYTVLMHRIVAFYCLALPFGIVSDVKLLTPVVVALVSYAFLALDAIGEEIENPFGFDPNDLPLSQLSTMIEINLRDLLAETDLPAPKTPERGILS